MRAGSCKHFNGMQNELCDAGVRYEDVATSGGVKVPGLSSIPIFRGLPCHGANRNCDRFCEPTAEEIAEYEKSWEVHLAKFALARDLIRQVKKQHRGKDWGGVEECPACKGKLRLSHAKYNGHVHGRCETADCLQWME